MLHKITVASFLLLLTNMLKNVTLIRSVVNLCEVVNDDYWILTPYRVKVRVMTDGWLRIAATHFNHKKCQLIYLSKLTCTLSCYIFYITYFFFVNRWPYIEWSLHYYHHSIIIVAVQYSYNDNWMMIVMQRSLDVWSCNNRLS